MVDLFGNPDPVEVEEEVVVEEIVSAEVDEASVRPLIGHGNELHQVQQWWKDGRFPHGLILHGHYGIGKSVMALHLAGMILGHEGDDKKALLQRIAQGGHPDFLKIGREWDDRKNKPKDEVSVAAIRQVPEFLRKTAAEGGWRVVLIDDADCMNRNAQNALLKSLEEPPKKTVLILVCHQIGSLIPTIGSRTQDVMLSPLTHENIRTILHQEQMNELFPLALELSNGSAGQALQWLESDILSDVVEVLDSLHSMTHASSAQILPITQKMGVMQDGLGLWKVIILILELAMIGKAKSQDSFLAHALPPHAQDNVTCWINGKDLDQLMEIRDKLEQHVQECETAHLDKYILADKGIRILRQVA